MLATIARMAQSRTYSEAIALLNTCQSNAATIEAIRKSGGRLNDFAIPEMLDYLRRIGYQPSDLNKLNVVHITGTKGKGSTSAFTERLLRSHLPSSSRIGLYTSPHLCAVRERIRINGEPVSEEVFAKYFFEVWERLDADRSTPYPETPTFPLYFRLLTLLAFHTFLSLGVDATVLEVGIGGLYDSTNIVPRPVVTGITALGLDHTAVLGNTIEEIARNKAGIYKPGIPALTVKQDQASAQQVLREVAERVGAAFEVIPSIPETDLGLKGKHQTINASLAVALAKKFLSTRTDLTTPIDSTETLPESFRKPLAETRWPGRCQVVKEAGSNLVWYLDGAHTVESLTSCGEWAWSTGKPNVLIFNCSGGRAGETLLRAMLEAGAKQSRGSVVDLGMAFDSVVFCTNVTYADGHFKGDLSSNALDPADLSALATQRSLREAWLRLIPNFDPNRVHAVGSIEHAIKIARDLGSEEGKKEKEKEVQVLVAGSLHLVGGVMEVAGLQGHLGME